MPALEPFRDEDYYLIYMKNGFCSFKLVFCVENLSETRVTRWVLTAGLEFGAKELNAPWRSITAVLLVQWLSP
jgi:hypothetical protein